MTEYLNTQYILFLKNENSKKQVFFFSLYLLDFACNATQIPNKHQILFFFKDKNYEVNKISR